MSSPFVPITTAEIRWQGNLPFSIKYNDIYYSAENGLKHSRYVFIDGNNLIYRWLNLPTDDRSYFNIAETGFGTGLNFLLTWNLWLQHAPKTSYLHYIACEKYPLTRDDLNKSLEPWPELAEQAKQLLSKYPILTPGYHQIELDDGRVTLTLMLGDASENFSQLLICGDASLEFKLRSNFMDAWYLDGFAPKKNISMWSKLLINTIAMLSNPGQTTLATYTSAAQVKTALSEAGFSVIKKKGYGPKRHMITASMSEIINHRLKSRLTPWHAQKPLTPPNNRKAVIIGAGLAGCFTAYSLAKRGWKVTLIDELSGVGHAGSANKQAVLFPKLSAYKSPLTQFMLSAFTYAHFFYKQLLLSQPDLGELNGALLIAHNEKEKKAQQNLTQWLTCYPELGELVDASHGYSASGLTIERDGLFIPLSGWINSPELCQYLIQNDGISLITANPVDSLEFEDDHWLIDGIKTPVVILANGNKINSFEQTRHLPVRSIRGQMTSILSTTESSELRIPLCAEGHVLPAIQGCHSVGATYELGQSAAHTLKEDDIENLKKLDNITAHTVWSQKVVGHWAGIRASTPDYLPLLGPLVNYGEFHTQFQGLHNNSNRWIPQAGPYYPGLYVCAGFGSRGLTTIPLSAEWLAGFINNELSCLPGYLVKAVSTARFFRKNITRGITKG